MVEVINWQEKYVNYVEGDLQKDIQELKDGQKNLEANLRHVEESLRQEIRSLDTSLRKEIKDLDTSLRKENKDLDTSLRQEIKDLGTKMDEKMDKLSTNINRLPYIISGAAIVALMGGIVGGLIRMFVK